MGKRWFLSSTFGIAVVAFLALNASIAQAAVTYTQSLVANDYTGGGTAKNWTDDDNAWSLSLPFAFPFYDRTYNTAYVSSNGYMTFDEPHPETVPDVPIVKGIFPYGKDLYARHGGDIGQDVRVDSTASEVRVTWNTETFDPGYSTTEYYNHTGAVGLPSGGTAQGWHADDDAWALSIPFAFPFYDKTYTTAYVSSNGYVTFGSGSFSYTPDLPTMKGIFAFGKDLTTQCSDTDVYTASTAFVTRIRWQARTLSGGCTAGFAVNVEMDLYSDGWIELLYGQVTDPSLNQVVGVSNGDDVNYVTSTKDHTAVGASRDVYEPNGGSPVNVELSLRNDGTIRMRYGRIEDVGGAPAVAISRGDGSQYSYVSGYNGTSISSYAQTVRLVRNPSATNPTISNYQVSPATFSPNGDAQAETATFTGSFDRFVNWSLAIKNGGGSTVRTYTGSGESISQSWDGKNGSGTTQPTGTYTGQLTATDIDNLSSTASANVFLDRTGPAISSLGASPVAFSPNGDGTNDTSTITATLSDPTTPINWTLDVKNASSTTVRTFTGTGTSVSKVWDGKNGSGVLQPDGAYTATLTATDGQANSSSSSTTVTVDTGAPTFSGVGATPAAFSPNADTSQDTTTLAGTISDLSTVSWTIEVSQTNGTVVRTFTGTGPAASAVWDGKNGSGVLLADGTYRMQVKATDAQNLNSSSAYSNVVIDTVFPTLTGYQASPVTFSSSTTFSGTATDALTMTGNLAIKNSLNVTVRSYSSSSTSWTGGTAYSQAWDGRDTGGALVPDNSTPGAGTYTGALTITDAAGNSTSGSVSVTADRTAPSISSFTTSVTPFSPNADGIKDTTTFSGTATDASSITWSLVVKNSSNVTVRTFSGSGGSVSQVWDGKNGSGVVQPDGTYTATVTFTDVATNASSSSVTVVIDKTAPVISGLSASPTPFSPNADGAKDTTTVSATLTDASTPVSWQLDVKNGGGTIVRTYTGSGGPVSQAWDGKNGGGVVQPNGTYTMLVTATDGQSLTSTAQTTAVLDTVAPTISGLAAAPNRFSPNADGQVDTSQIAASFSESSTWSVSIKNSSNAVVRTYSGSAATSVSQTWDGKNSSGVVVPDGTYTIALTATDLASNSSTSSVTAVVDNTKPTITGTSVSPNPFSPNGDGTNDTATFGATLSDVSTPIAWTVTIKDDSNTVVRTLTGTGSPVAAVWNGNDGSGAPVPEGTYTAAIEARDSVQNKETASYSSVRIDVSSPIISGLNASPNPFSPNGDTVDETTTISAGITDASPLTWSISIKNSSNAVVRSYSGTGGTVSQMWDGKNSLGVVVPNGTYTATLSATDSQAFASTSSVGIGVGSSTCGGLSPIGWSKQTPCASPPARTGAAMAYDAVTGHTVMFGGCPSVSPSTTEWASATTIEGDTGEMVMSPWCKPTDANGAESPTFRETWIYDGSNWLPGPTGKQPGPRWLASMAYDEVTGRVLMFGGLYHSHSATPPAGATLCWDQAVEFDNHEWEYYDLLSVQDSSGPLYAYCYNDLWEFDPITGWRQLTPQAETPGGPVLKPQPRFDAAMAGDESCNPNTSTCPASSGDKRGLPLLFSGCTGIGTWQAHGLGSHAYWGCSHYGRQTGDPYSFQIAGDERLISIGDTWRWNDTSPGKGYWSRVCPGDCTPMPNDSTTTCEPDLDNNSMSLCSPYDRSGGRITYNPVTKEYMLTGGWNYDPKWNYNGWQRGSEVWAFNGASSGSCHDRASPSRQAPCWRQIYSYGNANVENAPVIVRDASGNQISCKEREPQGPGAAYDGNLNVGAFAGGTHALYFGGTGDWFLPPGSDCPTSSDGGPRPLNQTWFWVDSGNPSDPESSCRFSVDFPSGNEKPWSRSCWRKWTGTLPLSRSLASAAWMPSVQDYVVYGGHTPCTINPTTGQESCPTPPTSYRTLNDTWEFIDH